TGLANRALFMDLLARAIGRARRRADYVFAVLFLDLDRFKIINDSLGHMIGDQLLVEIARRLESCVRPGDTVARLGGDEFTILVEDITDVTDAIHVAERIQHVLRKPFNLGGQEIFTSASLGIAMSAPNYDRPEEILRDADTAMYRAKTLGKSRHQVFDTGMHARAVALLHLETDLRRALERHEFRVHYQPTVSLKTGKLTGFEALLRWQHPERGLVLPAEFIPNAEETGLIIPIGQWVLREACRQMRQWQSESQIDLTISVNLSGRQFNQHDLVQKISDVLEETELSPYHLILEITESMLMENPESARAMLAELKMLNVDLHIDDFGTGYSSLSYLHHFPIDSLKIDRSFVSRMGSDLEIIKSIVNLAHNLRMRVIAEGVETQQQCDQLRALHCEAAQGFLFSKPVDHKRAQVLLAARPTW
ncbi:MAG TPA: EAL domain-containing protein, partial [Acidobacteriota bacterium]|nr:EAL domain-containing protein [Acidobacteriota bacterium]